jgi:hypothetical protein
MRLRPSIRSVHLRRALLLFAIVLGLAALVASLSRPIEDRRTQSTTPTETAPGPPTATDGTAPPADTAELPKTLTFQAAMKESKKLRAGTAATVEVAVSEPGTVDIPDMGLTAPADPVTPARFDLLPARPGRYPLLFTPAGGGTAEPAGSLVVTSAG